MIRLVVLSTLIAIPASAADLKVKPAVVIPPCDLILSFTAGKTQAELNALRIQFGITKEQVRAGRKCLKKR